MNEMTTQLNMLIVTLSQSLIEVIMRVNTKNQFQEKLNLKL